LGLESEEKRGFHHRGHGEHRGKKERRKEGRKKKKDNAETQRALRKRRENQDI